MADARKTIDDITRSFLATDITGVERFPGRDGVGDFRTTFNEVKTWLSAFFPAGTPSRVIPGQFTLSYSNTTTFGVAAGSVMDDTFQYALTLLAAWTKTTAAWAVGTGNGSLDTGSVDNSKTYHVFIIRADADGVCDLLISLSMTTPTMPAGYTYKRRIGCFRTNASAQIINFYQIGNMFRFMAQIDDKALAEFANTNRNLLTTSIPESCIGIFHVACGWNGAAAGHYIIVQSPSDTDSAPSITNYTFYTYSQYDRQVTEMKIATDSSRRIAYRGETTAGLYIRIASLGWIDPYL